MALDSLPSGHAEFLRGARCPVLGVLLISFRVFFDSARFPLRRFSRSPIFGVL